MDKGALKAGDICRIIKECKDSGVVTLKFGELHIDFTPQRSAAPTPSQSWSELQQALEPGPVKQATPENVKQEIDVFDEQVAEDALYAQMLIDDPAGFEKLQMLEGMERQRVVDGES